MNYSIDVHALDSEIARLCVFTIHTRGLAKRFGDVVPHPAIRDFLQNAGDGVTLVVFAIRPSDFIFTSDGRVYTAANDAGQFAHGFYTTLFLAQVMPDMTHEEATRRAIRPSVSQFVQLTALYTEGN